MLVNFSLIFLILHAGKYFMNFFILHAGNFFILHAGKLHMIFFYFACWEIFHEFF